MKSIQDLKHLYYSPILLFTSGNIDLKTENNSRDNAQTRLAEPNGRKRIETNADPLSCGFAYGVGYRRINWLLHGKHPNDRVVAFETKFTPKPI
jgi:hypothetical protein